MPPSDVSSSTKASTSEELRLRNYRTQLQNEHDLQVRDLEAKNNDEIQKLVDRHKTQMEQLHGAYDVQISEEAEALDERLQNQRLQGHERVEAEKKLEDQEYDRVHTSGQQRIAEYRKSAEAQLEKTRHELQVNSEHLHDKAVKSAKKEKEVTA